MAGGSTQGMAGLGTLDTLGSRETQYPSTRHASGYPWSYSGGMDQQVEMGGARQHMVPPSFVESLKEFSPSLPGIGTGLLSPQPGGGGLFGDSPTGGEDTAPPLTPQGANYTWEMVQELKRQDPNWQWSDPEGLYTDRKPTPLPPGFDRPTQRLPDKRSGEYDMENILNLLEEWKAKNPRPEGAHWNVSFGLPGSGNPQFSWAQTGGPMTPFPELPNPVNYKDGSDRYLTQRGPDWRLGDQFHNPNKPYDPRYLFNRGRQQPKIAPPPPEGFSNWQEAGAERERVRQNWVEQNPRPQNGNWTMSENLNWSHGSADTPYASWVQTGGPMTPPGLLGQQQGGGGILGNV